MALKDYAGAAIAGAGTIGGWLGIGEKRQDDRQISQQERLNEVNAKTAKEMADYEQSLKMKMWKDTNYGAQMKEAQAAGISKAAAIGGSGTGTQGASVGSVGGGSAADAAATQNAQTASINQSMMLASQINLMKAQKENVEADTENKLVDANKKRGVDTAAVAETTRGTKFANDLNELIGAGEMHKQWVSEKDKMNAETQKAVADWNAYKAAGFKGDNYSDETGMVAKAMKAGFEKAVTDVENAKKDGKLKDAERAIKGFEARMSEQGFGANSPWYLKLVTDLLQKTGVNIGGK